MSETTVQLRGYTLGAGPNVWIREEHLQFTAAEDRIAEEPQPNRDGVLFGGPDRLGGRDLLIPVVIYTGGEATKGGRIGALLDHAGDIGQAWRPADRDLTLNLNLGGARQLSVYGRPRPLQADSLRTIDRGVLGGVLRFRMARPDVFDTAAVSTTVNLLSEGASSGLGYPHGYPHGYGTALAGAATHTAGGRHRTWPVVVLRAGALDTLRNPTVINDTSGKSVGLQATITDDSQYVIDMYRQRVYVTQLGADVLAADPATVALVDRSSTVRHPNAGDWWDVGPEPVQVRLTGSGAGTAEVITRAAYRL